MKTLKLALAWICDHWQLCVIVVGMLVLLWLCRNISPKDFADRIKLELAAIRAKGEARQLSQELGSEKAKNEIENKYKDAMTKFNEEQKAEAERLRDDPVALADFIIHAAG